MLLKMGKLAQQDVPKVGVRGSPERVYVTPGCGRGGDQDRTLVVMRRRRRRHRPLGFSNNHLGFSNSHFGFSNSHEARHITQEETGLRRLKMKNWFFKKKLPTFSKTLKTLRKISGLVTVKQIGRDKTVCLIVTRKLIVFLST